MFAALVALALSAEPLSPDQAAAIRVEQQKAQAAVAQKYGNKKPSELSSDERREMIREQTAADKAVLDKAGVDAKAWARQELTRGRGEYQARQAAEKALKTKKEEKADGPKEITIQRGINEDRPVTLDEKEGVPGEVVVEHGLGSEYEADQREAREFDGKSGASDEPAPAAMPAPSKAKQAAERPATKNGKRRY